MTPGLLLPLGLAALAALIVPLVIHIARRSEEQPTDFAALRWLRQKPRPRSRLRFDEPLLLAARLVLLALLALWLARPVLFGVSDTAPYVAVVPGGDLTRAGRIADTAVTDHDRAHWLVAGFPAVKTVPPAGAVPVASLLRQLDADLPAETPLVVIVPEVMAGADAERPRLSRRVDWRVVPGAVPAIPAVARTSPDRPPALAIRHDVAHAAGLRYLRAAVLAWQPPGRGADLDVGGVEAPLPPVTRPLVWLAPGTLPPAVERWVADGGTVLLASDALLPADVARVVVWRDVLGHPLVEGGISGQGQMMRFTRKLAPAEMPELLEAGFPAQLRTLFVPPPVAPTRVMAADYSPLTGGHHFAPSPRDLGGWLAVLIGLVLLCERWLATRRRRGVRP